MKNLSLQSIQVAPFKSTSEAGTKADINADASASKSTFQATLSNQVQAKQAKHAQTKSEPEGKKTVAKASRELVGKDIVVSSQNRTKRTATVDELMVAKDDQNLAIGALPTELTKKLNINGLSSAEDGADIVVKDLPAAASDVNAVNLTASVALIMPTMNVSPPVAAQKAMDVESALPVVPAAAQQEYSGLDAVLNSALVSNKGVSGIVNNEQVESGANQNLDVKVTSDNSRWIDSMLLGAGKQTATQSSLDDSLMSKLTSNVGTDVAAKSLAQPSISNYQSPALQAMTAQPLQQTGSANNIIAYPGKAGWDQAIGQKVVWMVGAGEQTATLTLNPPDLGPLQVVIHVHNDQANTTFISDNAEVRQALENGFSNLRDRMGESGIQLGQANVSTSNQSQQEFQQATQGRTMTQSNDDSLIAPQEISANVVVRSANGLVDTFA